MFSAKCRGKSLPGSGFQGQVPRMRAFPRAPIQEPICSQGNILEADICITNRCETWCRHSFVPFQTRTNESSLSKRELRFVREALRGSPAHTPVSGNLSLEGELHQLLLRTHGTSTLMPPFGLSIRPRPAYREKCFRWKWTKEEPRPPSKYLTCCNYTTAYSRRLEAEKTTLLKRLAI